VDALVLRGCLGWGIGTGAGSVLCDSWLIDFSGVDSWESGEEAIALAAEDDWEDEAHSDEAADEQEDGAFVVGRELLGLDSFWSVALDK
jgi:hypothetical protein